MTSLEGAEPRSNTEGPHAAQERPLADEEPPRLRSWWRGSFGFEKGGGRKGVSWIVGFDAVMFLYLFVVWWLGSIVAAAVMGAVGALTDSTILSYVAGGLSFLAVACVVALVAIGGWRIQQGH